MVFAMHFNVVKYAFENLLNKWSFKWNYRCLSLLFTIIFFLSSNSLVFAHFFADTFSSKLRSVLFNWTNAPFGRFILVFVQHSFNLYALCMSSGFFCISTLEYHQFIPIRWFFFSSNCPKREKFTRNAPYFHKNCSTYLSFCEKHLCPFATKWFHSLGRKTCSAENLFSCASHSQTCKIMTKKFIFKCDIKTCRVQIESEKSNVDASVKCERKALHLLTF